MGKQSWTEEQLKDPEIQQALLRNIAEAEEVALQLMDRIRDMSQAIYDLNASLYGVHCLYCDVVLKPDLRNCRVPEDVLRQHVEEDCEKHPIAALKKRIAELESAGGR